MQGIINALKARQVEETFSNRFSPEDQREYAAFLDRQDAEFEAEQKEKAIARKLGASYGCFECDHESQAAKGSKFICYRCMGRIER